MVLVIKYLFSFSNLSRSFFKKVEDESFDQTKNLSLLDVVYVRPNSIHQTFDSIEH